MTYKKIIFTAFVFALLPFVSYGAEEDTSLFDVQTGEIVEYVDYDITKFDILVEKNPVANSAISYWKVRVYCEDDLFVTLTNMDTNHCNEAVTLTNSGLESFSLFFKNNTEEVSRFSYKLKAYDKNGDWLESQAGAFSWK